MLCYMLFHSDVVLHVVLQLCCVMFCWVRIGCVEVMVEIWCVSYILLLYSGLCYRGCVSFYQKPGAVSSQ